MAKTKNHQGGEKILQVLNVLLNNFAHGMTPTDLAKATNLTPSSITRYLNTLEGAGFAERIAETGRVRPSHKIAQKAVSIMRSLQDAQDRAKESLNRITKEI